MKKGMFLAIAVVVFGMAGVSLAQSSDLGVDLDVTWVSKYIWRGFDLYDDKAAFQPSVNIDLYGTGLNLNVWYSTAGSSGTSTTSTVNGEETEYTLSYVNTAYDGEPYKMNYAVGFRYYNYPDNTPAQKDAQEVFFYMELPEICPFGTTPHYMYSYLWSAEGGGAMAATSPEGSVHLVGIDYDIEMPALEAPLTLSIDAVYNDGQGGATVDHDWSHVVFGLKTSMALGEGKITPAIYFQKSMDDSVNTEDELWTGISYSLSF